MAGGALTNLTGADQLFISLGAPREMHWALGGVAASAVMEGQLPGLELETLKCAAAGYAGEKRSMADSERSVRQRTAPKTYWEEYIENDPWYAKKMLEDVPQEELWAAIHDEELSQDEGEEGDTEEEAEATETNSEIASDDEILMSEDDFTDDGVSDSEDDELDTSDPDASDEAWLIDELQKVVVSMEHLCVRRGVLYQQVTSVNQLMHRIPASTTVHCQTASSSTAVA
ncbi:MAG: hypothetical protein SGPRY_009696 [Prymnesium sp.]